MQGSAKKLDGAAARALTNGPSKEVQPKPIRLLANLP